MAVPHIDVTDSQQRLLAELMLDPLPLSADEDAVARGLSLDQLQADTSALQWMGLINESDRLISVTVLGAAVFHRAEQEKAEDRLTEVVAFADALEAASKANIDQCRVPAALRRLAQGGCSLREAIGYLYTTR
ncbi:hypothetical protein ACWCPM_18910 [Streptomyces sp. NPDC002309]